MSEYIQVFWAGSPVDVPGQTYKRYKLVIDRKGTPQYAYTYNPKLTELGMKNVEFFNTTVDGTWVDAVRVPKG